MSSGAILIGRKNFVEDGETPEDGGSFTRLPEKDKDTVYKAVPINNQTPREDAASGQSNNVNPSHNAKTVDQSENQKAAEQQGSTPASQSTSTPATRPKMPTDRMAMMQHVSRMQKELDADTSASMRRQREARMDESKRRLEGKLMEREDYTFTAEGERRLRQREERFHMRQEEAKTREILRMEKEAAAKREQDERKQRVAEQIKVEKEKQERETKERMEKHRKELERRRQLMLEEEERRRKEAERLEQEAKDKKEASEREELRRRAEEMLMLGEDRLSEDFRQAMIAEAARLAEIAAREAKVRQWEEEQERLEEEAAKKRREQKQKELEEIRQRRQEMKRLQEEKEERLRRIREQRGVVEQKKTDDEHQILMKHARVEERARKLLEKTVGNEAQASAGPDNIAETGPSASPSAPSGKSEKTSLPGEKSEGGGAGVATASGYRVTLLDGGGVTAVGGPPSSPSSGPRSPKGKQAPSPSTLPKDGKGVESGTAGPAPPSYLAPGAPPIEHPVESIGPDITKMTLPELGVEMRRLVKLKRNLKITITDWVSAFKGREGREPSLAEKEAIAPLYRQFNAIEQRIQEVKTRSETMQQQVPPATPVTETPTETPAVPAAPAPSAKALEAAPPNAAELDKAQMKSTEITESIGAVQNVEAKPHNEPQKMESSQGMKETVPKEKEESKALPKSDEIPGQLPAPAESSTPTSAVIPASPPDRMRAKMNLSVVIDKIPEKVQETVSAEHKEGSPTAVSPSKRAGRKNAVPSTLVPPSPTRRVAAEAQAAQDLSTYTKELQIDKDLSQLDASQLREEEKRCIGQKKAMKSKIQDWCKAFRDQKGVDPTMEDKAAALQPFYMRYSLLEDYQKMVTERLKLLALTAQEEEEEAKAKSTHSAVPLEPPSTTAEQSAASASEPTIPIATGEGAAVAGSTYSSDRGLKPEAILASIKGQFPEDHLGLIAKILRYYHEVASTLVERASTVRESPELNDIAHETHRLMKYMKELKLVIKKWSERFKQTHGRDAGPEDKKDIHSLYLLFGSMDTIVSQLPKLPPASTAAKSDINSATAQTSLAPSELKNIVAPEKPSHEIATKMDTSGQSSVLPAAAAPTALPTSALGFDASSSATQSMGLEHLRGIRQQLHDGKNSVKTYIKQWCLDYEKKNGKAPTSDEKTAIQAYYLEYERLQNHFDQVNTLIQTRKQEEQNLQQRKQQSLATTSEIFANTEQSHSQSQEGSSPIAEVTSSPVGEVKETPQPAAEPPVLVASSYVSAVVIESVSPDSPADDGGLAAGDIIVRLGTVTLLGGAGLGTETRDKADLSLLPDILTDHIDRALSITLLRQNEESKDHDTIQVTITPHLWAEHEGGLLGCVFIEKEVQLSPSSLSAALNESAVVVPKIKSLSTPTPQVLEGQKTNANSMQHQLSSLSTESELGLPIAIAVTGAQETGNGAQGGAMTQRSGHSRASFSAEEWNEQDWMSVHSPFACVDVVHPRSPAEQAGLAVGDLILRFGSILDSNINDDMSLIGSYVKENIGKDIAVWVQRWVDSESFTFSASLVPQKWNGEGLLGFQLSLLSTKEASDYQYTMEASKITSAAYYNYYYSAGTDNATPGGQGMDGSTFSPLSSSLNMSGGQSYAANTENTLLPFAAVDSVMEKSPAAQAGLQVGDYILQFATVTDQTAGENLKGLLQVVRENVNKEISVTVQRWTGQEWETLLLKLTPREWPGVGLLGCTITSWSPSDFEEAMNDDAVMVQDASIIGSSDNNMATVGGYGGAAGGGSDFATSFPVDNGAGGGEENRGVAVLTPFAMIDAVTPGSPAEQAGIATYDYIAKFGSVTAKESDELRGVAKEVGENVGKAIEVLVQRWDSSEWKWVALTLCPRMWDGPGYLGCTISPWTADAAVGSFPCQDCLDPKYPSSAHAAACLGHLDCLQYLTQWFDVFVADSQGRTPLFFAAATNHLKCAALLVSIGSEWVDVCDSRGDTPLHAAVNNNAVEVVQFLLESEAKPNPTNLRGLSPAHIAVSVDVLRLLHQYGTDLLGLDRVGRPPLYYYSQLGNLPMVDLTLEVAPESVTCIDESGETALHAAASRGHVVCIRRILKSSAQKTLQKNRDGNTALDLAMKYGHHACIELLSTHFDHGGSSIGKAETEKGKEKSSEVLAASSTEMLQYSTEGTANREISPQKISLLTSDNWMACSDPATGHQYYYNTVTGESQWECPT